MCSDKRSKREMLQFIFSGLILYDPLPKLAVKKSLGLLKTGIRWAYSRVLALDTTRSRVRRPKLVKKSGRKFFF